MTAVSLIVRPDAGHLVTDGAYYAEDGKLLEIGSKVACFPSLGIAVACSGSIQPYRLEAIFASYSDAGAALADLPDLSRCMLHENNRLQPSWAARADDLNAFQLAIVAWSTAARRARGFVMSTNGYWGGRAFELTPMVQMIAPPPPQLGFTVATFDPRRHAAALLSDQRAIVLEGDGSRYVGGFGEVTWIDGAGIHQERVVDWADCVGERIAA